MQDRGPGRGTEALPRGGGVEGRGHDVVQFGLRVDPTGPCRRLAEMRVAHSRGDLGTPLAVSRQVGVGVGAVGETVGRGRALCQPAVLNPIGSRHLVGQGCQRVQETLFLPIEEGPVLFQLENRGHEVLLRGALLEATDQIRDGNVEFSRMHDRGVEQQRTHIPADHLGLARGHSQQHLEIDADGDGALLSQQPGERHVEKVVPGHPDPDVGDPVRVHRVVEHRLVGGVGLPLGVPGRQRPAVQIRVDQLHRQVRALDHTHLDRGTAGRDTRRRPLLQADHRRQRVGKIGLKNDPGFEFGELGSVEQAGEHRDGQLEILVLLHVQVDELAGGYGGDRLAVERREPLGNVVDGVVEGPVIVRSNGRRNLDRHVVHVVAGEQLGGSRQPPCGLALAQNRLAEQVDVEVDSLFLDLRDGLTQLRVARVDDEVADHHAKHPARQGDNEPRRHHGEHPAELHRKAHVPGQECRRLTGKPSKIRRGDAKVLGADHSVDETDREFQPIGVFENPGQLLRRGIHGHLRGFGQPVSDEVDRPVGQVLRTDIAHGGS